MSFDKVKAMRNAERFLAQGKIRAAIGEYKRVVENDPKDFGTLNILGDLYMKNSEQNEAVGCFTQVAEHYNKQGFAQKAIAVYNKISRLKPNSIEVSSKLAQLYKTKGSIAEARTHYTFLAEQYQNKGQKLQALEIWKQIADLDPNNTDIYLKIAEVYSQENQKEDAVKSFTEAAVRLAAQEKYELALGAFSRALEINPNDFSALNGQVKAQIKLGYTDEAIATLEKILEEQPFNRDIIYLLIDCYLETENVAEAERAIIKLVEQEPANYTKFLDLVEIYLKNNDLDSAARILSMSSEHLLIGGQSEEFLKWTNEILARNPEHLEASRLLVRYYSWQRDETELKNALERLAEAAHSVEAVDDEKYALTQLILIAPHEVSYAQRFQELKMAYGFDDSELTETADTVVPQFENFAVLSNGNGKADGDVSFIDEANPYIFDADVVPSNGSTNGSNGNADGYIVEGVLQAEATEEIESEASAELSAADELKLHQEIESVEFYIAQGYKELAEKSLVALENTFGKRAEFDNLRLQMDDSLQTLAVKTMPQVELIEPENVEETEDSGNQSFNFFSEFKDELGLEESESVAAEGDYDTHYHTAIAYKEMGLMEEAIREFQDAINLVKANDGTRRFFQCCNLLGHCFMEMTMPNLALMWFKRAVEISGISEEEKQALHYELANAFEKGGEREMAISHFEKIYAENVDYRDVGKRLEVLKANGANS